MTYYHGTMAFGPIVEDYVNGPRIAIDRIKNLTENNNWEICCSHKPIGEIGVIVEGTILKAFNGDVSSYIDANGHRVRSSKHGTKYREMTEKEIENFVPNNKTHSELWVTKYTVTGIWMTDSFEWENEELMPLIEVLGLPITII